MVNAGNYKGRAIKNSVQLGETDGGTLQMAIDLDLKEIVATPDGKGVGGTSVGQMTTFLYFSTAAAPYSYERLKALGWKGNGPDDIDKTDGIDANEVDARVTAPESYKAADGTMKTGSSKLEIQTGGGKVVISKPLDTNTFKARLKAIGGSGPAPAASGGGPTNPPF